MTTSLTHVQRVVKLYKMILRLHRGLPKGIKELGDVYVKDEFRRHKKSNVGEASVFLNEWTNYAINLSEQLGVRGPHMAKRLGKPLRPEYLKNMKDDQIYQLYELMKAATEKPKE